MTVPLTREQRVWIEMEIASGAFASQEEAERSLAESVAFEPASASSDDLAWAKPLVEEAKRNVADGDVLTLEEYRAAVRSALAE